MRQLDGVCIHLTVTTGGVEEEVVVVVVVGTENLSGLEDLEGVMKEEERGCDGCVGQRRAEMQGHRRKRPAEPDTIGCLFLEMRRNGM
jgi:hypothetical protein